MPNNDILPYSHQEALVTPDAAQNRSTGVAIEYQATRMGLTIVAEVPGAAADGDYSVVIETAVDDEDASGEWFENTSDRVDGIRLAGTYTIYLTQPVLDKVRARINNNATNPERVTFQFLWGCDTPIESN